MKDCAAHTWPPVQLSHQKFAALEKDICQAHLENHQLRLEVHRWRKQQALVKLRLAGAQEDLDLQGAHCRQLEGRCDTLDAQRAALAAQLEDARLQLADVKAQLAELAAVKAGALQEASKLKVRSACQLPVLKLHRFAYTKTTLCTRTRARAHTRTAIHTIHTQTHTLSQHICMSHTHTHTQSLIHTYIDAGGPWQCQ